MPAAAPTGPNIGWGAELWIDNALATPVPVEIVGVMGEIMPPDAQADDVEVTTFKSPGRAREYIAGLITRGEGTFSMLYVPGNATDLLLTALKNSGKIGKFSIKLPNAAGIPAIEISTFVYVKGYKRGIPIDDKMTSELTVKYTGAETQVAI